MDASGGRAPAARGTVLPFSRGARVRGAEWTTRTPASIGRLTPTVRRRWRSAIPRAHAARVRSLPGRLRRPATVGRDGAAPHPSRHRGRDRRRRRRVRHLLGARAPLPRGVLPRVVVAPRLPGRRRADQTHPRRDRHLQPVPADQPSRPRGGADRLHRRGDQRARRARHRSRQRQHRGEHLRPLERRDARHVGRGHPRHPADVDAGALLLEGEALLRARALHPAARRAEAAPAALGHGHESRDGQERRGDGDRRRDVQLRRPGAPAAARRDLQVDHRRRRSRSARSPTTRS